MNTSRMGGVSCSLPDSLKQPTEMVKEYPVSSVMVAFGIGIGVGVLLGQALAAPLASWVEPEPSMAQRVGRQVLEAVRGVMPASMSR